MPVTLYINDTSIRLMVTSGKRITKLADAPLEMNPADTSPGVREAEITAKIKQLLKANKVTANKVAIGLSGMHCLSRPATLPQLPKAMLNEALLREANRVLPVPLEQLYLSWQILPHEEEKMLAFMVGIPRHIADPLLEILHELGIKPYLMDIKPLALARLVQEPTAMVVDVQAREFDIVIISDGVPQPIRTVPFTDDASSLTEKMQTVKDELKRTIQFFNSNNPEKPLTPEVNVYVSGELFDEPELHESLANETGYPILPLVSPLKCAKHLDPTHFMVNIGLALKELPREAGPMQINLNTLPDTYQPKPISLTKLIALPTAAVAVGVIALLAVTVQDAAAGINSVSNELEATNMIITQRQSKRAELEESIAALEAKLSETEEATIRFNNVFENIELQGSELNSDLEATVDNLLLGLEIASVSHSGDGLSISGSAMSEAEVLQYAKNLDNTGRFSEITVSTISLVEGEEGDDEEEDEEDEEDEEEEETTVNFNLSLRLNRGGE
jgi:type IV pilus assembly protein PilM